MKYEGEKNPQSYNPNTRGSQTPATCCLDKPWDVAAEQGRWWLAQTLAGRRPWDTSSRRGWDNMYFIALSAHIAESWKLCLRQIQVWSLNCTSASGVSVEEEVDEAVFY